MQTYCLRKLIHNKLKPWIYKDWDISKNNKCRNFICVFLYFKIQCFPVISFLKVKFFYKIGPLTSIEPCYYIQRLIFECKSGMEVSSGIQVGFLCPSVSCNVINFTLIHAFLRQRRTNCKYLWFLFLNKHTCQRVSSSFKKHVSSLN